MRCITGRSAFESSVILEGSKTYKSIFDLIDVFESSVILEGSKTSITAGIVCRTFESSVILEGSKTRQCCSNLSELFESSVILEGSKTRSCRQLPCVWFESSVILELTQFHAEVLNNLNSIHGALLRMNRSIQSEGTFGTIKWNRSYIRARRRGLKSLFLEFGMISCGFNLHKFHLKKVALRSAA